MSFCGARTSDFVDAIKRPAPNQGKTAIANPSASWSDTATQGLNRTSNIDAPQAGAEFP
jgi:hypothetical protein